MKHLIMAMVAVFLWMFTTPAWAGPYLNTSAMLLHENSAAGRWVRANLGDKQLAMNAHKMAQARVDVASKMLVPEEVREAHPHLLLTLTAMERAMQAATNGQVSAFIQHLQSSSGEEKTFRAVLKTLGYSLPNMQRTSLHEMKNKGVQPPALLARTRPPRTSKKSANTKDSYQLPPGKTVNANPGACTQVASCPRFERFVLAFQRPRSPHLPIQR